MIILNMFRSWRKGYKIQRLQNRYETSLRNSVGAHTMLNGKHETQKILMDYFDLCLEDKNIREICNTYDLKIEGLREVYLDLLPHGLGSKLHNHLPILSTLAYPEPLEFTIVMRNQKVPAREIAQVLYNYWDNQFQNGHLFQMINNSPHFKRR